MALQYYPRIGEILSCDFTTGFIVPEMTKTRPVVVVGPRLRRRESLVTVVPLSTSVPNNIEDYHCELELRTPLPPPFHSEKMWAKCDMVVSVSRDRLDRFKKPRNRYGGARKWTSGMVNDDQLKSLKCSVLCGLGLSSLTINL